MPQRASGYQSVGSFSADPSLHDGNDAQSTTNTGAATGFEESVTGKFATVALSGLLDFGPTPAGVVAHVYALVRFNFALTLSLETASSLSGPWTQAGTSSTGTTASPGGIYTTTLLSFAPGFVSGTPRYWRLSLSNYGGGFASSQVGLMELWATNAAGATLLEPTGTTTTETDAAFGAGKNACLEGGFSLDSVASVAAGRIAGADPVTWIGSLAALGAGKASLTDLQTSSGGANTYLDLTPTKGAAKSAPTADTLHPFETPASRAGGLGALIEVYERAESGVRFFDTPAASGGGQSGPASEVFAGSEAAPVLGGGRGMAMLDVLTPTETCTAKAAAKAAAADTLERSGVVIAAAAGAGRAVATEPNWVRRERTGARAAAAAHALDPLTLTRTLISRGAGKPANADTLTLSASTANARGGGKPRAYDTLTVPAAVLFAKGAGKTASTDPMRVTYRSGARAGGGAALANQRTFLDTPSARGAGVPV